MQLTNRKDGEKLIVLGHRGYFKDAKENSLKAYESAVKKGADGIELDVHITKDDKLVVIHDFNAKRVWDVDLEIESSTLDEIKAISEEIPTLREVFSAMGNIYYDIELKGGFHFRKELAYKVNEELEKHKEFRDRIIVSSFNPLLMHHFSSVMSYDYPLLPIYDNTKAVPPFLHHGEGRLFFKAQGLKPRVDIARREKAHKKKYPIVPWPVDSEESLIDAIELKAPIIITNESKLITASLKERNLH